MTHAESLFPFVLPDPGCRFPLNAVIGSRGWEIKKKKGTDKRHAGKEEALRAEEKKKG